MSKNKKDLLFIVEDSPAWAAMLAGKLGNDYLIVQFTTGEDAVKRLSDKPRIIILDYHLAGRMTGLDTLKEIRKQLPDAYVVIFSAQEDVQTAIEILDNGAYDYVVKDDNAINKLQIILRNIEETERLRKDVIELRVRIKKIQFYVTLMIVFIFTIVFLIYLWLCPDQREWKWDPFNRANSEMCKPKWSS